MTKLLSKILLSCAMLMSLLTAASSHAARSVCETSFDSSTGILSMEAVKAGSARYQVRLSAGSSALKLESAYSTNSDCYDPDYYADGLLTILNVKAGNDYYYAELSMISDSNPAEFTVRSAEINHRLVPEAGVRINNAGIPFASVSSDGTVYLGYEDSVTHKTMFQSSADGINFSNPTELTYSNRSVDSRRILMPDGKTWRLYQYDPSSKVMTSYSSADGNNFTPDSGVRYSPHTNDNNSIGVYDHYIASDKSLIMIYVGDLYGKNNLRMARSTDNGLTFTFHKGNVLGDDDAGGGGNTFVDNKTISLQDGSRRMFAMRALDLYSFVTPDGINWTREPGVRVSYRDFASAGINIYSLNDPVPVYMPDGTCRIYVAATASSAALSTVSSDWVIVSASWSE